MSIALGRGSVAAWICGFMLLGVSSASGADAMRVKSPAGILEVKLEFIEGIPHYSVHRFGKPVVLPSKLGFELGGGESLSRGLKVTGTSRDQKDETWTQPWGEEKHIRNHYNELAVQMSTGARVPSEMTIRFRVFDDGLGFRYELGGAGGGRGDFLIMDEVTEFDLTANHKAWWIPAYSHNRYEYRYNETRVAQIEKAHTPATFETADGLYISIHEAALTDFASMTLWRRIGNTFEADLVPWSDGVKVRANVRQPSPWRTIQIADTPGGLLDSYIILNLNEPNKLGDVSWIKPGKYIGIWWEMHLAKSTWGSGPKHGATTENAKRYIDFAAQHGIDGVLVEGWNLGWDGNWIENGDKFDFTTPYPDYDLEYLAKYARDRGVYLIGHHETGGGVDNYERQLEDAYALLNRLGMKAVKTGYVAHAQEIQRTDEDGNRVGEWHHGQYMVRHYRKALQAAAKYQVMVNVHEPIKGTGIRRTYPNMLTREGACGQEFNAWGGERRNLPNHTTILPFTRMLSGPMDFTPGTFDLLFNEYRPNNRVSTTLAKQLALFVVLYSPLQMASDLPENYEARMDMFQFIKDVPADWAETEVINGRIGDYVTIARKDRNSDDWYVGSITDEFGRVLQLPLSFLGDQRNYVAEIYRDGPDADWDTNPYAYEIKKMPVTAADTLTLRLAPGGGTAIRITPVRN